MGEPYATGFHVLETIYDLTGDNPVPATKIAVNNRSQQYKKRYNLSREGESPLLCFKINFKKVLTKGKIRCIILIVKLSKRLINYQNTRKSRGNFVMTIKDAKKNYIIDVACDLFLKRSISEITIKDIAKAAGVGEATVYRYFTHKQKIAVSVAENLQKKVYAEYFEDDRKGSGFERIKKFYGNYADIFSARPEFYKFIKEFDAYMLSEGAMGSKAYSSGVDMFKSVFDSAYDAGVIDKSVKKIKNPEVFYYSTTHAMLELCKKLSVGKGIIKQDETTDKVAEISEMKDIILSFIANSQA